ncbi:TPA: cysteine-rich KTR domain-containing protein, partial [Campylobacter coli]
WILCPVCGSKTRKKLGRTL